MRRYRLFAPGPTPVPESVRLRMAEAVLHHRTPAFSRVIERVRSGIDAGKIVARLRDHYNLTIAGGQDQAKSMIFRIAHMGDFDEIDILTVTAAVESAFADVGFEVKPGAGVVAAEAVLAGGQE